MSWLSKLGVLLFGVCLCVACGIFDFRPVFVKTNLDAGNTILPERTTPVTITFSAEPVHIDVEKSLTIENSKGQVSYDVEWQGNCCIIRPCEPWIPSEKYWLELDGSIKMLDGRRSTLAIKVPFYAVRNTRPPYLISAKPENGARCSIREETVLELVFSEPMDTVSVEQALVFTPDFDKTWEWSAENTVLRVRRKNDKPLEACVRYSWKLLDFACGSDSAPLQLPQPMFFLTLSSTVHQEVVRMYPARFDGASLIESEDFSLEAMDLDSSIIVEFAHDIDAAQLADTAMVIEPGIKGSIVCLSPRKLLFVPRTLFMPESNYVLAVSKSVSTMEGMPMVDDYYKYFKIEKQWLKVTKLSCSMGTESTTLPVLPPQPPAILYKDYENPENYAFLTVKPWEVTTGGNNNDLATEKRTRLIITFNEPFLTVHAKESLLLSLRLKRYNANTSSGKGGSSHIGITVLPIGDNGVPSLMQATWTDDTTVMLDFNNITEETYKYLYELTIAGGAEGVYNGTYLRENLLYYVEVQP